MKEDGGGGGQWEGLSNGLQLQSAFILKELNPIQWRLEVVLHNQRGTQRNPEDRAGAQRQWQGRSSPVGRNLNRSRACRAAISPVKRSDGEMEVKSESEQQSSEWMIDLHMKRNPDWSCGRLWLSSHCCKPWAWSWEATTFWKFFKYTEGWKQDRGSWNDCDLNYCYSWEQVKGQQHLGKMTESCSDVGMY